MSIRKLQQNISDPQKLIVSKNQALLFFYVGGLATCLYLDNPNITDVLKISCFDNFKNVKFVGDEHILNLIFNEIENFPRPEKVFIINHETTVFYHPRSGRIRVERETRKKNVLIIDDSKTIQKILSTIILKSSKLHLVGVADRPSQAKKIIEENNVDIITLDIHMPEMNGVEFLKSYISLKRIPTVMISSVSMNEGPLVLEALSSGASSYIQKPSLENIDDASLEILEKLETLSQSIVKKIEVSTLKVKAKFNLLEGLIAIGSSTGGTQALEQILTALPEFIPPIVIVQHIPAVFSKALAERLNNLCPFNVKEAEDGEFLLPNTVYIAPGGKQFKLLRRGIERRVAITDDPPVNRFQPSVDYLFDSIAALNDEKLVGVILTGMGKDGAKGLLSIKEAGGRTIAQDEKSSIVFGMPKEAINIGAAQKVVSLDLMAASIVEEYNKLCFRNVA